MHILLAHFYWIFNFYCFNFIFIIGIIEDIKIFKNANNYNTIVS